MFFKRFKKSKPPKAELAETPPESVAPADANAEPAVNAEPADEPPVVEASQLEPTSQPDNIDEAPVEQPVKKPGFFGRIKQGLSRTRGQLVESVGNLVLGKKVIDEDLLEELETELITADLGIETTTEIIDELTKSVKRKELTDGDALFAALKAKLYDILVPVEQPLVVDETKEPFVILVVGVNGVGKTTTIGKMAKQLQQQGLSVMLAAGDTFRAAAVEQLQVWGERNQVPVVAQHTGADSASVIFDALSAAKSRNIDVIIADTAGRLHNKSHLMDELSKVKRVMGKLDNSAPHEVLLVLDAGTGQNAINQAEQFIATANVTGIALTKLDGTAKGGIIFALSQRFKLPIRAIGVGEGIDDLQPFEAKPFIDALFAANDSHN